MNSLDKRNFDIFFLPMRSDSSSSLKSAVNGLFTCSMDVIGCWLGDLISLIIGLVDDAEEMGFNLKRISTKGRADEVLREFICKGKVIGDDVEVVIVVVVLDDVDITMKSVGGFV